MENKNIKKKNYLLFITGIFMIFIGILFFYNTFPEISLPLYAETIIKYTMKTSSYIGDSLNELIDEIKTARSAKIEIENLKSELDHNRDMLIDYHNLKIENAKLLKFYEISKENPQLKLVATTVLGKLPFNEYGDFVIDVGTNKNISMGDPVISHSGFVGFVSRASSNISVVQTILSPKTHIGAKSSESGANGIITGDKNLSSKSQTRLNFLHSNTAVSVGDTIKTSGMSGIYPKDIKIATVESIKYDANDSSYYAIINPFTSIKEGLNYVFVITDFSGKNIIDLN